MSSNNEYATVIRLDNTTLAPSSHELLLPESTPAHVLQYCRTMTLAQGRVLYELWDSALETWHPRLRGYLVPAYLANEARRLSCRHHEEDWKDLQPLRRERVQRAWEVAVRFWPRMPVFAARRVAEGLGGSGGWAGEREVGEAVVRYALRNWTSYWVRLEARGVRRSSDGLARWKAETEVEEAVSERLREVLESWMGLDVSTAYVEGVFEQRGLRKVVNRSEDYEERRWFS